MSLHNQLSRTIRVGLDAVAVIRVDKWRGGELVFLDRIERPVRRITPKQVYIGNGKSAIQEVYDRKTGARIMRRELRAGARYSYMLERVYTKGGLETIEMFSTAAAKDAP